jgi:hypothetical protein
MTEAEAAALVGPADPELFGDRWRPLNCLEAVPMPVRREILARERVAQQRIAKNVKPNEDRTNDEPRKQVVVPSDPAVIRELDQLHARVLRLESLLGPNGEKLVAALAEVLPKLIDKKSLRTQERLTSLEVKQLEIERDLGDLKAKQLRFTGTHVPGTMYRANDLTIRQGGLWICRKDTTAPPGASDDWQLAVKRGSATPRGPAVA